MVTNFPLGSTDFLATDPAPVSGKFASSPNTAADRLPQSAIDILMRMPGVDGVWIERDNNGQRMVVIHYTPRGKATHLPRQVEGIPTRIVGGEPIRAI